ncbi:hypothetical protein EDD18DRAFT_1098872 [Armillaria luteobubalina]|uniref:Uncharacterized protein n=1 Tax=Armillaria luteobubalina TaxID=153913 RepID=A0AA39QM81_9AGAR|nr:hypothetical protein EDD18DRAFT_1098872 [Armillaria luteobubalina]
MPKNSDWMSVVTPAPPTMSPNATLDPAELTTGQILEHFRTPDGLLDTACFIKSYQTLNKEAHLVQTLWATQLQVTELVEKNQLLKMLLPAHSKKGHANSLTQEQSSDIRHYAQCCVSTVDPWVDDADIFQAQSEEQGLYAEVYAVLKEEHCFFFQRNYGPAFIKSASDSHSICISHVKNEAFHSIFRSLLPPSVAVKGFDPFTDSHCQELLGYDPQKKVYSTLPPILWPNTVLLAIFYSAMSIKEKKVTKKKPTSAVLWKVEQITPGAIAFAAIVACYVLSGDKHFDKCGGRSRIPYAADFKFYKMTIVKNMNKSHMVDTVTVFNHYLFEGRRSNRSGNQLCSNEYETIDIGNDFTDSSGSDDEPLDVPQTKENIVHDNELASAPTAHAAVDKLVGSVAGVTLSGVALLETEPTATGPENRSQNDPRETGGAVRSEGWVELIRVQLWLLSLSLEHRLLIEALVQHIELKHRGMMVLFRWMMYMDLDCTVQHVFFTLYSI